MYVFCSTLWLEYLEAQSTVPARVWQECTLGQCSAVGTGLPTWRRNSPWFQVRKTGCIDSDLLLAQEAMHQVHAGPMMLLCRNLHKRLPLYQAVPRDINLKRYARAKGVSNMPKRREYRPEIRSRFGVSETVEYWEKVQRTSARPHVDLVPGKNGTGTRLMRADT
jgi:hypothetical protein